MINLNEQGQKIARDKNDMKILKYLKDTNDTYLDIYVAQGEVLATQDEEE